MLLKQKRLISSFFLKPNQEQSRGKIRLPLSFFVHIDTCIATSTHAAHWPRKSQMYSSRRADRRPHVRSSRAAMRVNVKRHPISSHFSRNEREKTRVQSCQLRRGHARLKIHILNYFLTGCISSAFRWIFNEDRLCIQCDCGLESQLQLKIIYQVDACAGEDNKYPICTR